MRNPLFFAAIIPPRVIASEILDFKEHVAKHFHSKRALSSPAHITIIPPFQYAENEIERVVQKMKDFMGQAQAFYVTFNSFSHFRNKVVYVNVEKNLALSDFQKGLTSHLNELLPEIKNKGKKNFHPHATIAFRDLDPQNFELAWKHFKNMDYFRVFECSSIYLLKHNGKRWEIFSRINMNI